MKKAIILLLGLFVASLAAFAVPKEIKENPTDQVIKVFVISENEDVSVEAVTIDIVDADVGDFMTLDEFKDTNDQDSPALHSEIFRLDISWRYCKNEYLLFNQGRPMLRLNQIRHPVSYFHRTT